MRGNSEQASSVARLVVREDSGRTIIEAQGVWTIETIAPVDAELRRIERTVQPELIVIDLDPLEHIDTAGAYILGRVTRRCSQPDGDFHFIGSHPTARRLIAEVRRRTEICSIDETNQTGILAMFARLGAGLETAYREAADTFGFLGRTLIAGLQLVSRPWRLRLTSTVWAMEEAGVNAMPIVAVLAFFIGAVVAYMGASLLQDLGFSVLTVQLVGIAMLREFGVLITAIMLAGRSASAFTASIGSMKMQQEIDAMRVLGLDPFHILVIPRVIACILMTPLLTFGAMIAGIFGGMLVTWSALDLSPTVFIARFHDEVGWEHFFVGMSKAPIFGLVVATVGCRQGLRVRNDVESLGRRVTASVVQSIFAIIVLEALFAMMYLELGI